ERFRAQLMLALYRSGRQAEALEAYQDVRGTLVGELGIEPSHELRDLHRRILAQDPELDVGREYEPGEEISAGSFVGRRTELDTLRTALDDAIRGQGRFLLIAGEPGIGKSRLAEEGLRIAHQRGVRVLVGRCWEAGGAPAYWPWVQALRPYLRELDPDALRASLGSGAADIAQLFPDLRELLPDLPEPPAPESAGARIRLFDATVALLDSIARERPLAVFFDDLHAADEPSLLLL